RRALSPPLGPGIRQEFLGSRLADQVEQITVTPQSLTTEEISRLWSALQAHYRPSAAYLVTVVLLEAVRSTAAALPVQSVGSVVQPLPRIAIESIEAETGPGTPILPTSTLLIDGQDLRGAGTRVLLGGVELTPAPADVGVRRIRLPLPAPLPAGIHPGLIGV